MELDRRDKDYSSDENVNEGESTTFITKKKKVSKENENKASWTCLKPSRFCLWLLLLFLTSLFLLLAVNLYNFTTATSKDGLSPPWYPTPIGGTYKQWSESFDKASKLISQMTLIEKVNITTGVGWSMGLCVGNTGPVARLGFPSLCLQDGPLGIRFADNITAFPAGITIGASWDKELMYQRGKALGREAFLKGINVLLGPALGPIGRSPLGGRNWEGFGSDPVLQAIAASQTIMGVQSQGVMATAKHFVGNEQEHFRQVNEWLIPYSISSNMDDRTLHELYAWPFQDSVRVGVASVMCSYQQLNNSQACQNSKLMNGILKDEFGFQGWIQSDWLGTRSGVASVLSGLDNNMPGDGLYWTDGKSLWGSELTKAVLNGSVPIQRLNDMVTRIVTTWYEFGQDDKKIWGEGPNFSSFETEKIGRLHFGSDDKTKGIVNKFVNAQEDHATLARKIAAEATILVKNTDSFLPLTESGWPNDLSKSEQKKYQIGIIGTGAFSDPRGPNACADRSCGGWTLGSGWGSGAVEFPYLVSPWEALEHAFDESKVDVHAIKSNKLSKSDIKSVKNQDLCIVFLTSLSGEGFESWESIKGDRNDLFVQNGGEKLIKSVSENCGDGKGDVVVVIHSVGPVSVESFVDNTNVKAILFANLPGEESGNALKDVLFGHVNPSGRFPYTNGKTIEDYGPSAKIIRSVSVKEPIPQANFSEGLLIDYRHFDHYNIEPRYEFGFGLSYTTFEVSDLVVDLKAARSPLPAPRPSFSRTPPTYNTVLPDVDSALFPAGFRKLKKYIYPYLSSDKGIVYNEPLPVTPSPLSPAGGAPGGNPALFETIATVKVNVLNTGNVDGATVVQLYVSFPDGYVDAENGEKIEFPVKVLRNFEKLALLKGKSSLVKLDLTRRDLSYWSTVRQNWVIPAGKITLRVGFSSRDLPLTADI